ncbi:MAG TPA: hypothetical protein PK537_02315 [Candidatus Limiplasma sp.]|nr:hypothetical protein [Candidatus Limiplasma sp.]
MKKLIAVLLALTMAAALCATAAAATYTAGDYYAITYPDELLLDDTSYAENNTEDDAWLFMLEGDDFIIDAYWMTLAEYADFSLSNANAVDEQMYLNEIASTFAEENPELLSTVATDSGLVFYVFRMTDDEGVYLYAEVIENGVCANFVCYYFDAEPDEALLQTLETVLQSVAPAAEE